MDKPNVPVIKVAQMFKQNGFRIIILSGRLKTTKDVDRVFLSENTLPSTGSLQPYNVFSPLN